MKEPMIYLIVGHRGVGKTLWLKKLQKWFTNCPSDNKNNTQYLFLDLDQEIEKNSHKQVSWFFKNQKSQHTFRRLEQSVLTTLINKYKLKKTVVFIAVGAGFDWKNFKFSQPQPNTKLQPTKRERLCHNPELCHIIHLIRETSAKGRVFLDRPRLDKNKKPYEEYMSLYLQREKTYQQIKTESFVLPEQDFDLFDSEALFFDHLYQREKRAVFNYFPPSKKALNHKTYAPQAIITLNKKSLPTKLDKWPEFIQKRLAWGLCSFELKEDQLNKKELKYLLNIIPNYRMLFTFYSAKNKIFNQRTLQNQKIPSEKKNQAFANCLMLPSPVEEYDWPLEKGMPCPLGTTIKPLQKKHTKTYVPNRQPQMNPDSTNYPQEIKQHPIKLVSFPPVLSLHARKKKESFKSLCQKLVKYKAGHFKLAVPVKNFSELMQGHLWFLQDPQNRSFLPVSGPIEQANQKTTKQNMQGRWRWYRQIFGPYMKLNFIREGPSLITDQPFLYEYLISLKMVHFRAKKNLRDQDKSPQFIQAPPLYKPLFSAVLGEPVDFSASPAFHRAFFEKHGMVFVKIPMREQEMTKKNLNILHKMGLGFSAVTSPLKKKAFKVCDITEHTACSLKTVNTLIWKNQKWWGANTDYYGFKKFLKKINQKGMEKDSNQTNIKTKYSFHLGNVAVWGGRGVLPLLKKELPYAEFYSARTGNKHNPIQRTTKTHQKNRSTKEQKSRNQTKTRPNTVIWAVGRSRMPFCRFPPSAWHPKWVIDLNYADDSPGREYALLCQAKYISGKTMFKYQAQKQQSLFLRHIHSSDLCL